MGGSNDRIWGHSYVCELQYLLLVWMSVRAGSSGEGRGQATPRALRIRDLGAHEGSLDPGAGRVRSRGSRSARVAVCTKSGRAAFRTRPIALRARGCVRCVARVPRPDVALARGSAGWVACRMKMMCALPGRSPLCHRLAYAPLAIRIHLETACLWAIRSLMDKNKCSCTAREVDTYQHITYVI